MGEAKRRKEADPDYGKKPKKQPLNSKDGSRYPELRKDDLGVIVSNPIEIEGSSISGSVNLDPQELRYSILFWDLGSIQQPAKIW